MSKPCTEMLFEAHDIVHRNELYSLHNGTCVNSTHDRASFTPHIGSILYLAEYIFPKVENHAITQAHPICPPFSGETQIENTPDIKMSVNF